MQADSGAVQTGNITALAVFSVFIAETRDLRSSARRACLRAECRPLP